MAKTELITTLHKGANTDIDVFPNIKKANIPSASIDESKVDPALLQKITPVVANPTIVGSEADLTSIQVGDTKYKVTGGGGGAVAVRDYAADEWTPKTWSGLISFYGNDVWTDGENIYYSAGLSSQYVLDKSTSTWSTKTWSGIQPVGSGTWTDGENIYYTSYGNTYILDTGDSRWDSVVWSGDNKPFMGNQVWRAGNTVYYTSSGQSYVLNKSISTWEPLIWTTQIQNPEDVWTDGENTYYSAGETQYIYNASDIDKWGEKTWNGLTSFDGRYIWTNGEDVYYSNGENQYILDKTTSTWIEKEWSNLTSFDGRYIWVNEEDVYYSNNLIQYTLNNSATHPATVLAKVAETGDYNDLTNKPTEGMDITAQEIAEYFEVCDVAASVTTEGDDIVLNLTNADIVTENGEPVLTTEVPNVSVQNNILEIE